MITLYLLINLVYPIFFMKPDGTITKGLFTWREGAPANQATWLEGLKHSPPLHASYLTGTVGGLREVSLERPLSTTNITADEGNFFPSHFSFLHGHGPVLCLRLVYIDLFRLTVILIALANGNYKDIHFTPPCFRGLSHLG